MKTKKKKIITSKKVETASLKKILNFIHEILAIIPIRNSKIQTISNIIKNNKRITYMEKPIIA